MHVLISGGGTAGHIHPALSVAAELESDGHSSVGFVGTPNGPEARLARAAGLTYHALPSRGYDRGAPLSVLPAALTLMVSTVRAFGLLRRERPDVVVGFGGYVAMPLGLAAAALRIPLVLHEQNSVPGLANRVLSRWARAIALTYAESADRLSHPERAVVTGNPVRAGVVGVDRGRGRERLDLADHDLVLFVFGGSRGARHVNRAVVSLADRVLSIPEAVVLHVTGRLEYAEMRRLLDDAGIDALRYRLIDWLDDMGAALAAADLVVARAGASSVAEITALGRAAVLIPFPHATDDHQTKNARAVADAGGAVVVGDADLDADSFGDTVMGLLQDASEREKMAQASATLGIPDAAARVVKVVRKSVSATQAKDL